MTGLCRPSRREEVPQLARLWKICFGDTDDYIAHYFSSYYRPDRALVLEDGGKICSMLLTFPNVLRAISSAAVISIIAFLMFQIMPHQIISIFGDGSTEYFQFAEEYFRIYLFFTFINFLQPLTSNFFTSIGKPTRGVLLSLTRQIIFLLPLLLIFPLFMGIDGIMYAGPVADGMAAAVTIIMIIRELREDRYRRTTPQV